MFDDLTSFNQIRKQSFAAFPNELGIFWSRVQIPISMLVGSTQDHTILTEKNNYQLFWSQHFFIKTLFLATLFVATIFVVTLFVATLFVMTLFATLFSGYTTTYLLCYLLAYDVVAIIKVIQDNLFDPIGLDPHDLSS